MWLLSQSGMIMPMSLGNRSDHAATAALAGAARARRRRLKLTQRDVADLAGCSDRSVRALEQGKPTMRLDVLLRILDTLGLRLRVETGRGEIAANDEP